MGVHRCDTSTHTLVWKLDWIDVFCFSKYGIIGQWKNYYVFVDSTSTVKAIWWSRLSLGFFLHCFSLYSYAEKKIRNTFEIILWLKLEHVCVDVTQVLCELELTIRRVKVSTTPDGRVVDLFFITDNKSLSPSPSPPSSIEFPIQIVKKHGWLFHQYKIKHHKITIPVYFSFSLTSALLSWNIFIFEVW